MNSLSWLIYIGELVHHLKVVLCIVLIGSIIGLAGPPFIALMDHVPGYDDVDWSEFKFGKWYTSIGLCLFLMTFLPSQNVIYAIAASEMGEEVLKNEEVRGVASEATTALRNWIKEKAK